MMDEKRELKKRIEASNFAENNGAMIRVINILDGDWIRLATIKTALPEFSEAEFWDSLTYLQKKGSVSRGTSIQTRRCWCSHEAESEQAQAWQDR